MASSPVIIRPLVPLSVPLVYNDSIDTASVTNVVLIDSIVANDKQFYDSVNATTFPIIYNYNSSTENLIALLREKFPASSIQRIALVFHDKGHNFTTPFMNGKRLFEDSDLEDNQTSFTENVSFLINCIKEFDVVNIDFLACNTLQYSNWKSYYALLASQTSVVIGASNNETGNINYGGDWVMENTNENIRDLYFTANISNYASTLTLSIITLDGASGDVELRMDASGVIEYYNTTTTTWTPITSGDWPVQFINSNLSSTLNIVATQNLTITGSYGGTSGYFIAGSTNITFDGSGNTITMNTITDYPGFIDNYNLSNTAYANIIVQNFTTAISGVSTLITRAGWLCQQQFGWSVSGNQIIGCTNTGAINADESGGIVGASAGGLGGSISFTNCRNSGEIGAFSGGVAGAIAGQTGGSATFTNCANSGVIGFAAGGIGGNSTALFGTASFTNCTNSGVISGLYAGGIVGGQSGSGTGGSGVTITSCANTGQISGNNSGGIIGGFTGLATCTGCVNSGIISGFYSGGIAGNQFGYNITNTSTISQCYSTGAISGTRGGGIVGADVGYTDNASYNPIVNITNCYSLGAIASTAGGICGGTDGSSYVGTPIVTIINCYSWGLVTTTGSGIVAISLPITTTKTNTYIANGSWSDTTANANLTGTPTSLTTGNPGATWEKIANNTTTPYLLSSFNAQLYSPNSASSSSNYTTSAGLFIDPSYNYRIVYNDQSGNVATTLVFVAKGSTPYYYSYNSNTFTFTNSGTATDIINASITQSNGILDYQLSPVCFRKGTKILCENDIYIPIEEIKIGNLVKTYKHGYQKVIMSVHRSLCDYSQNKLNQLYTYSREKNPDLIEDLHLTGGHSLLLDTLTEEESNDMKQIQWADDEFVVDDKYKLLACFSSELCVAAEQHVDIYHFTLEPPKNAKPSYVYGIYANGILAESCSQGAIEQITGNNRML